MKPDLNFRQKVSHLSLVTVSAILLSVSSFKASGQHWAFQTIPRGAHEALQSAKGCENPIDVLIDQQLEANGLQRSAEADRTTLIRRLYLNLLGVPPTPDEVNQFINNPDPNAFETLVDQALNDPRYGERWARHWLDVIRFAETNGFETNRERLSAWRFRDYVIAAFNEDKPYDQFVKEQIAGDVFGADVGTGFLVGGPVDIVKSPDPELTAKQRADELDDMVNTTGTAFMGLTLGCARCHSHKFDPVSHEEYYSMTAMFSGVRHGERPAPVDPDVSDRIQALELEIAQLDEKLKPYLNGVTRTADTGALDSGTLPSVNAKLNIEEFAPIEISALRFVIFASSGGEPCIDELEVFDNEKNVALASSGVIASASSALPGYAIHKIQHLNDGKPGNNHSWISNEVGQGWAQLDFPQPVTVNRIQWGRDRDGNFGDRVAALYRIEVKQTNGEWTTIASSDQRKKFTGFIQRPDRPAYLLDGLEPKVADQVRMWMSEIAAKEEQKKNLSNQHKIYAGNFVEPDPAFILHRGDPMLKKEEVAPATLSIYKPLSLTKNAPDQERRKLLAEWITDEKNPLTARVIVNRIWQYHFGVGIVNTPSDLGVNGAEPTHPELIDWMADFLMSNGWSIKKLQRKIVLSQTWRQSNEPNAEALRIDAGSRLLWRFPPRRMEAEVIRDSILSVSGLLDNTMGGPSFYLHDVDRENVYHYHPKEEFGPDDMRRMVYAFKVRMEPDAIFGSFDCPDGSLAVPKRSVSTTPLQALNLFNSEFLIDQAEALTGRLATDAGINLENQVERLWMLSFSREPDTEEKSEAVQFASAYGMEALCRATLNSNEFLFIP